MQGLLRSDNAQSRFGTPCTLASLALLLAGAVLAAGCGSSMKTTLEKEWQVEAGEGARTINVEPEREQLLVGKDKSTTVYDADGSVLFEGEDGSGRLEGGADRGCC